MQKIIFLLLKILKNSTESAQLWHLAPHLFWCLEDDIDGAADVVLEAGTGDLTQLKKKIKSLIITSW